MELIDQQMAHPRIQALLQPARELGIGQQPLSRAFDVVHVHPRPFVFELAVGLKQDPRQTGHALVVRPRLVLLVRTPTLGQLGLGGFGRLELFQVFAQPVFFLNEQGFAQLRQTLGLLNGALTQLKRFDYCIGGFAWRGVFLCPQSLGPSQPTRARGCRAQRSLGCGPRGQMGVALRKGLHRRVHHPLGIGQAELHTLAQCLDQRFFGAAATKQSHRLREVFVRVRVCFEFAVEER